jgi:hypothetical protein
MVLYTNQSSRNPHRFFYPPGRVGGFKRYQSMRPILFHTEKEKNLKKRKDKKKMRMTDKKAK